MVLIAYLIAITIPVAFLYFIYTRDLYKTGAFRYVIFSFVWGLIAYLLAAFINSNTLRFDLVSYNNVVRFQAPILEEVLKAIILYALVRRKDFNYFVDGAIYGFSVGIGFAIIENFEYLGGATDTALAIAISRVISTNLIHAAATAITGIALGYARFKRFGLFILTSLLGLLMAMILHIIFNNLVTRVESSLLIIYAAILGIGGGSIIYLMIRRGLKEEKAWIEEKLGAADRVTSGEAAVVNRLEDLSTILAPARDKFGSEKSEQIEKFLTMQANIGIKRKMLDMLADDKMRSALQVQIEELRREMDETRRLVGSYGMMYVRTIFPEDASPLWDRLQSIIQERAVTPQKEDGPNVWATLGQRTAEASAKQNETD
jgi:RsiW-degrading membrane proteinase PrsW (M82 family)